MAGDWNKESRTQGLQCLALDRQVRRQWTLAIQVEAFAPLQHLVSQGPLAGEGHGWEGPGADGAGCVPPELGIVQKQGSELQWPAFFQQFIQSL